MADSEPNPCPATQEPSVVDQPISSISMHNPPLMSFRVTSTCLTVWWCQESSGSLPRSAGPYLIDL